MTTIGDVLDEFFSPSPFAKEKLWVMPEGDNYTQIVREWRVVIDAVDRIKRHLSTNCATWQSRFMTNPAWKPVMSDAPKPGAHREFIQSPPGTDQKLVRKPSSSTPPPRQPG